MKSYQHNGQSEPSINALSLKPDGSALAVAMSALACTNVDANCSGSAINRVFVVRVSDGSVIGKVAVFDHGNISGTPALHTIHPYGLIYDQYDKIYVAFLQDVVYRGTFGKNLIGIINVGTQTIDAYLEQDTSTGVSAVLAYRDDGPTGANVYIGGIIDRFTNNDESYMMSIIRIYPSGAVQQASVFEAYGGETN